MSLLFVSVLNIRKKVKNKYTLTFDINNFILLFREKNVDGALELFNSGTENAFASTFIDILEGYAKQVRDMMNTFSNNL